MEQRFDIMNRYQYPLIKLCKPDTSGEAFIYPPMELKITMRFNRYNEISFWVPSELDDKPIYSYDHILCRKVIDAQQYGRFIITDVKIVDNGIYKKKEVTGISYESILSQNKIARLETTLKLYNPLNPNDTSTLLGFFHEQNPSWEIGKVDSELWDISRTFDSQSVDWYNFLVGDVSEKYKCFFFFDNVKKVVNCKYYENAIEKTNIFVCNENLVKNIEISEDASTVCTAMNCNGAEYLDIRGVNPLGINVIYDFSYFKNTEWLPQTLIDKITAWEKKIKNNEKAYTNLLTSLSEILVDLTSAQTQLTEIETDIKKTEQAMAMSATAKNTARYQELVAQKNIYLNKKAEQNTLISKLESDVEKIEKKKKAINNALSFENNFTSDEYKKMQDIIIVNNRQVDSFRKTSIMSPAQVQQESLSLYNFCKKELEERCMPTLKFSADMINFIFLKEFDRFTKQADIGKSLVVEINRDWRPRVIIVEISLDFDNPTNFSMQFSNRPRLDTGKFSYMDLQSLTTDSSISYSWDKAILSDPVKSGKLQEVTNFIGGNFEAAKNALMAAQGVGISFDGSGLHGRRYINNVLQKNELWMTDNMLGFSNDNFNTVPKIAIGEFQLPNSSNTAFGVNAEFIAGRLVVGNQFVFESETGAFKFDSNGAELYNAVLKLKNNLREISIDPTVGIKIKSRKNSTAPWVDNLFFDDEGNGVFSGKITTKIGDIGGLKIGNNGIYNTNNGDFWGTDGSGKFGLLTYKGNSATFDGNIYAKNLKDYVTNGNIQNNTISGSKLEASYRDGVTNAIASVEALANSNNVAVLNMIAKTNQNVASVKLTADANSSSITAQAKTINFHADTINVHGMLITENIKTTRATIDSLNAANGRIDSLNSEIVRTNDLFANYATINSLNAANGRIDSLYAERIDTKWLESNIIDCWGIYASTNISSKQGIIADGGIVAGMDLTVKGDTYLNSNVIVRGQLWGNLFAYNGKTGSFKSGDGKTIKVTRGIITGIDEY